MSGVNLELSCNVWGPRMCEADRSTGDDSGCSDVATKYMLEQMLDERFDAEALAQTVEHLSFLRELSGKLETTLGGLQKRLLRNAGQIDAIMIEIRDLLLDVTLLKRAVVSLGQVGVMERERIERELIREVLPPSQPRPGTGVVVSPPSNHEQRHVDCEERLAICKAACCRIFEIGLAPSEIESGQYDWDPRHPYTLHKNRHGCTWITVNGCSCSHYDARPAVCRNYACERDQRIWADYGQMILNPLLKVRLDSLIVDTGSRECPRHGVDSPARDGLGRETLPNRHDDVAVAGTAPPNFDELKKMIVPLPKEKFVPPEDRKGI